MQGRRLMRSWFLRPVINLGVIRDRLDAVELLVGAPDLCTQFRSIMHKVSSKDSQLP